MDPRERFTSRAEAYRRFRPDYPEAAAAFILDRAGLAPDAIVADIGCGTGLSSEGMLRAGLRVIGVEPNAAMREAAGDLVHRYANYSLIDGSAEQTNLSDRSVDLVLAAQAYHWFDPARSEREFARILRPPRWVALMWNERTEDTPEVRDYEAALCPHTAEKSSTDAHRRDVAESLQSRSGRTVETFVVDNPRRLTEEHLIGAASSASYMPVPGTPEHDAMAASLRAVFAKHQSGGVIELAMKTKVYLFRLDGE